MNCGGYSCVQRYGHSAASYMGSQFIFGGTDGTNFLNDLAQVNKSSKWLPVTATGLYCYAAHDSLVHIADWVLRGILY